MTFNKYIQLGMLFLVGFSLAACGHSPKQVENTPRSSEKKEARPAEQQDKRAAFENIKVASATTEFKGGSSLADLTQLYGQPSSHETKTAGNAKLDVYSWKFGQVTIQANLFEDSTIVKSIANFYFNREKTIDHAKVSQLKKGMTYAEVVKRLTEPDDYTLASSSNHTQLQAIWVSGLKAKEAQAHLTLFFENDHLVDISEMGLKDR
ncbi:DUF3862 domain-containing protein [Streptococcus halichoeri]|uniref:DUF3862 domain-containing protein n=1 Tax=Streptococcus halichoeri TaxID=254785 RepID=UPI0013580B32|nr:DUF3862 domain-containing protein [Streptococcus halichoeri]